MDIVSNVSYCWIIYLLSESGEQVTTPLTIDYDTVIVCIFSGGRTNVKPVARISDEKRFNRHRITDFY